MSRESVSAFVAAMKLEIQRGTLTQQSEHHLRREFSAIGWDGDAARHAARVDEEIARLEGQAATLRALRAAIFGQA